MKNFKSKAVAICASMLVAACACVPFAGCVDKPKAKLSFLTTEGKLIKNEEDETVYLRGINAGGLFVTEHWMTGFLDFEKNEQGVAPKSDYKNLTKTFLERFGEDRTQQLWEEYRTNWWTEDDFKACADMGMTAIRLPFTYMNVDFDAITDYENAGQSYDFSALDEFVQGAAEYGLYTILDLHGAYGSQNGQDHSGEVLDYTKVDFYSNEQMQSLTVKLWTELSEHYKDNPNVAAYDILNEPGERKTNTSNGGVLSTEKRHWDFYDKVYKAIRGTGDGHIVIFESCWDGQNLPKPAQYGWENCAYSFHHYVNDQLSDEAHLSDWENKIKNIENQNFGVPLYMGEFTGYSSAAKWESTLGLMNKSGWHWTSWTYKVWGRMAWGVQNIIGEWEDKVDAEYDDYEVILNKFQKLQSSGESSQKYTFYKWNADGEREKYKTLEQVLTEYCNPLSSNENIK